MEVTRHVFVGESLGRGRCLFTSRALRAGDVVLQEDAFVSASWDSSRCLACDACHHGSCVARDSLLGIRLSGRVREVEEALSDIDGVGDLDRARLLLKVLSLPRLVASASLGSLCAENLDRSRGAVRAIRADKVAWCVMLLAQGDGGGGAAADARWDEYDSMSQRKKRLSGKKKAGKARGASRAQVSASDVFDSGSVSKGSPSCSASVDADEYVSRVLSVLNTNSHTLEHLGGSGLFLRACLLEHSCVANCSYTSEGSRVVVTALRDVSSGEALSIDYVNGFCDPTGARQAALQHSYAFTCSCAKCVGDVADRCRAFLCPRSSSGIIISSSSSSLRSSSSSSGSSVSSVEHCVCAIGGPETRLFRCLACGHESSASEVRAYVAQEATAVAALKSLDSEEHDEMGEEEEEQWSARLAVVDKQALLRPEHHLRFKALEHRAVRALECGGIGALELWTRVYRCADLLLPERHHERVMVLDRLAQVQFKAGQMGEARATYVQALQCAIACSGPPELSLLSRQLQHLVDNMPSTLQELVEHYEQRR